MRRPSFSVNLGAMILLLAATPAASRTEVPVWEENEVVDTGAIEIPSSAGPGIVYTPDWPPSFPQDQWHLVYVKAGDVFHAVRTTSGWQAPEAISTGAGIAKDPKLAFADDRLLVVWQDDRRGHPEIWCREWDGVAWGAETGLSDDGIPSQAATVAGGSGWGCVVWQEGIDGQTRIAARRYISHSWYPVEIVSHGSAPASEPSICYSDGGAEFHVLWTDARHGATEIYLNSCFGSSWSGETRFTNMPGACRRPSAYSVLCCGDALMPYFSFVFENDATGVPEVWGGYSFGSSADQIAMISEDDGRASQYPQVHGYDIAVMEGMGGVLPSHPVTWTEEGLPGARTHLLGVSWWCEPPDSTATLSDSGIGTSSVAAVAGNPDAGLLATWIEEREGVTSLVARRGSLVGCVGVEDGVPAAILLTPGGTLGNKVTCSSMCLGSEPIEGLRLFLDFASDLDSRLTWDAVQIHPHTPPETTGVNGSVELRVRGGGCSRTGYVNLRRDGVVVHAWTGARSPDVNGDCAVLQDDLLYVTSMLNTGDFCADLDGSGTVTALDVEIVEEALGSLCSQLVGVEEDDIGAPGLHVAPNPSKGIVAIRFGGGRPPGNRLEIFDAPGRLIRVYDVLSADRGTAEVVWDGLDSGGRAVPAGLYCVRLGTPGARFARPVVIIR